MNARLTAGKISWTLGAWGGNQSYTFEGSDDDLVAARLVSPNQLPGTKCPAHRKFKYALEEATPHCTSRLSNGLVRVKIHAKTVVGIIAGDTQFKRFLSSLSDLE